MDSYRAMHRRLAKATYLHTCNTHVLVCGVNWRSRQRQ